MFKALLLTALLVLGQKPEAAKEPEFGAIAGSIVPPEKAAITQPVQVILLAPQYVDLWNVPAFAQKKELFIELSRNAYQESLQFVVNRMSRDLGGRVSDYRELSTPDGKFEFKHIPLGEYKVVAMGKAGDQTYIWQESTEITSSVPLFLQLKKRVP
jgi:hypothetical protein